MLQNPSVIFEDNHLLVLNKPSGWLSQGDNTGDESVVDWAKEYIKVTYNKPGRVFCGLPHRLDRPVSGVIVLCKTSKSLERMTQKFANSEVRKEYWAIVTNSPPQQSGQLKHWLKKDHTKNRTKTVSKPDNKSKAAQLSYEVVRGLNKGLLLHVFPETGRPHQIRAQLSAINSPILGDLKYGGEYAKSRRSIALHSRSASFVHPVSKEEITVTAEWDTNPIFNKIMIHD